MCLSVSGNLLPFKIILVCQSLSLSVVGIIRFGHPWENRVVWTFLVVGSHWQIPVVWTVLVFVSHRAVLVVFLCDLIEFIVDILFSNLQSDH